MYRLPGAEVRKIIGFGCVGFAAFLGYLFSMSLVVEGGGHPISGAVVGFAVGTTISFYGNCRWVFKSEPSKMLGGRFLVVTVLGLLANVGIAALLTYLGVHYILMTVIIFVVVPIFNFLGHRLWTFTGRDAASVVRNV